MTSNQWEVSQCSWRQDRSCRHGNHQHRLEAFLTFQRLVVVPLPCMGSFCCLPWATLVLAVALSHLIWRRNQKFHSFNTLSLTTWYESNVLALNIDPSLPDQIKTRFAMSVYKYSVYLYLFQTIKSMANPHDVAVTRDGDALYVAEIGPNKIWKFRINDVSKGRSNRARNREHGLVDCVQTNWNSELNTRF